MTLPVMAKDDQISRLVVLRGSLDSAAFYYRRRGVDAHDRTHAIALEDGVATLDDVIGNLRRELADRAGDPGDHQDHQRE